MQVRIRGILLGLIAAGGGIGLAMVMGASAGAAGPTTTTLADGSRPAAPNRTQPGFRLLMSAVVKSNGTTTTTGTTTTGTTTTFTTTTTVTTTTTPPGTKPVLGNVSQTHKIWRRGTKL